VATLHPKAPLPVLVAAMRLRAWVVVEVNTKEVASMVRPLATANPEKVTLASRKDMEKVEASVMVRPLARADPEKVTLTSLKDMERVEASVMVRPLARADLARADPEKVTLASLKDMERVEVSVMVHPLARADLARADPEKVTLTSLKDTERAGAVSPLMVETEEESLLMAKVLTLRHAEAEEDIPNLSVVKQEKKKN